MRIDADGGTVARKDARRSAISFSLSRDRGGGVGRRPGPLPLRAGWAAAPEGLRCAGRALRRRAPVTATCPLDAFGIAIGVALGALVPPAFFRYAQSLWLMMNCVAAMAEQRHERERLQR